METHAAYCKMDDDCECDIPRPIHGGLTDFELERLVRYNSECDRGIMHTREHILRMKVLQDRFNDRRV